MSTAGLRGGGAVSCGGAAGSRRRRSWESAGVDNTTRESTQSNTKKLSPGVVALARSGGWLLAQFAILITPQRVFELHSPHAFRVVEMAGGLPLVIGDPLMTRCTPSRRAWHIAWGMLQTRSLMRLLQQSWPKLSWFWFSAGSVPSRRALQDQENRPHEARRCL